MNAAPPSSTALAVEVVGLEKRYGLVAALRAIDLSLMPGEFLALAGPNGAGKTTLLEILAGLRSPTAGASRVLGAPTHRLPSRVRARIAYVGHANGLYAELSARANLRFYANLWGCDRSDGRIAGVLADFDLAGREDEPVSRYSRGMARKVALARAVLAEPDLFLLDEPFDGLDEAGIGAFQRHLALSKSRGAAAIFSSHLLEPAFAIADRTVGLHRGRIAFLGPVSRSDTAGSIEDCRAALRSEGSRGTTAAGTGARTRSGSGSKDRIGSEPEPS